MKSEYLSAAVPVHIFAAPLGHHHLLDQRQVLYLCIFFRVLHCESDAVTTVVKPVKVYDVKLGAFDCLSHQLVPCEDGVVVELLADYPGWENRAFHVLAHLNVLEHLEHSQEPKLRPLTNPLDPVVVYHFVTVEAVGTRLASNEHVHQLLGAVSVVTDQGVFFVVHLALNGVEAPSEYA